MQQSSSFVMEGVKNLVVKKHNLPVTKIVDELMEVNSKLNFSLVVKLFHFTTIIIWRFDILSEQVMRISFILNANLRTYKSCITTTTTTINLIQIKEL